MASAVTTQKIASRMFIKSYDHDPGATSAVIASADGGTTPVYVDMSKYEYFGVMCKPNIVGGSGLTKVEIVASAATTFSSVTVVKDSGTVAADALADNVWQECTAQEVVQLGETLRYVAARLTMATATDEATVTYVAMGKGAYPDMTATAIT